MGQPVRIEMFCHGALCMAVSGKCYLSLNELNDLAALLSALQQPSRYSGSRSAAMPQVIGFMSIPPFVR